MNTSELLSYIGRTGLIDLHGLTIAVRIVDSKVAYGGLRVLVAPLDDRSSGQTWIEERKVRFS